VAPCQRAIRRRESRQWRLLVVHLSLMLPAATCLAQLLRRTLHCSEHLRLRAYLCSTNLPTLDTMLWPCPSHGTLRSLLLRPSLLQRSFVAAAFPHSGLFRST